MDKDNADIARRLARIESRLCQLMLHMGLDPQIREYDEPHHHDDTPEPIRKRNEFRPVWKVRDKP